MDEVSLQCLVEVAHRSARAQLSKTGHAMSGHTAWHDAGVMAEIGSDIDAYAMKAHPAPDTNAYGGDLVLNARNRSSLPDPHAHAVASPFSQDVKFGQAVDQPLLELPNESPDIPAAPVEVEHDIGHTLARPMIGELASPAGAINGKAIAVSEVLRAGAGSCRIERR